ncbi:MAG: hypothetical protein VBE63_11765 [Lamprobacter sp.]|uniref:hypothetical protein n=1 Tax=Lamprobacter sp. TaxID=3100796 RepID=UPI002B2608DC|nr:hypothetical protein [Lamprobacter sp.]MEA3640604.1 hypothetical protein [Lamprobacter sp.]
MASEFTITFPRRLFDKRLLSALLIALTLIGLAGCRTSPVRELNGQPVPPGVSAAEVSKTIQSAGNSLGWAMKQTRPGLITGTIYLRDHMAKVEIPYSSSSYSIRYASSTNLKYDASKRTIHSNYNSWVQNLDNQIRARLASL